jgi:hypothetical protein
MNIRTIKRAEQRIDVQYLSTLGIKSYGYDNLYPQRVSDIIAASPTGTTCLNRYARFIEGAGFSDLNIAAYIVNRNQDTADDIVRRVAQDIAKYGGFALHVNYDIFGDIVELQHVPFETCRLAEDDDSGYISTIVTHPDWTGRKTRNGHRLNVSADSIQRFPAYNPIPEALAAQIADAGGIGNYQGQILWVSCDGKNTYPVPKYDCALAELSTDEGLGCVKQRNVRNNFLPAGMVIHKRSQGSPDGEDDGKSQGFTESLTNFQGDERACNFMDITLDYDEDAPEFREFPVRNFDKDFTATDTSVISRIYATFEQEVFDCIRIGKLGFSGDVIRDAYNYYSSICDSERRMIERAFQEIFRHWHDTISTDADFSIQPLKLIGDGNTDKQG